MRGLSLVVASGGHSSSQCVGLSLSRPLLLWSTGSRCAGSVIVAHGPSCSVARGIFPDQGSNPCPLHWQADSQSLRHQGSPDLLFNRTTLSAVNTTKGRRGDISEKAIVIVLMRDDGDLTQNDREQGGDVVEHLMYLEGKTNKTF